MGLSAFYGTPASDEERFKVVHRAIELGVAIVCYSPSGCGMLGALVKEKGCTSGQLTLAWILAQGDDVIPIPGTSKIKNLEENAAAVEIQEIRGACEKEDVAGGRSLEQMAVYLFGDSAPKRN